MTEKKPAPPIVYVLLTLAAAFAVWLVWDTFVSTTSVPKEQQEAMDRLNESTAKLREVTAEVEAKAWGEGVAYATTAAKLTQTAKTPAEWKAVEGMWTKAAGRMYRVPKTDPNYATAQQRMVQYQENAEYAKKNAGQ